MSGLGGLGALTANMGAVTGARGPMTPMGGPMAFMGGYPGQLGYPGQPGYPGQTQMAVQPPANPPPAPSSDVGGGAQTFKSPAPNYTFHGAEDSMQAMLSASHIGIVLLGAACIAGGCIGMSLAGGRAAESDDDESDDEK